ncbi:MAG TPA: tetratricopeptide repeat protein [Candidatus Sulfotelmatobacter sp.]|nr:tetratricopeptide repeat protein [Candidatus Sulfotelmatobacter sp.]
MKSNSSLVDQRFRRALALQKQGHTVEARNEYLKVLEIDPSHGPALNNVGSLLLAAGNLPAARIAYAEAVARHPNDPVSRSNLGNLLREEGELAAAREHYEHALRVDPNLVQAHEGLSYVLADLGDEERAAWHRRKAFEHRFLIALPYLGKGKGISVLQLVSSNGGNVRTREFLDERVFRTFVVLPEFYDRKVALPPHQMVFNAIGDADVAAAALTAAEPFLALTQAPVINPPSAVLATRRLDISRRLSGLPGVVTPRTVALPREILTAPDAEAALAAQGFRFPVLLRTPGFHTGDHFVRAKIPDELPAALAQLPGQQLLAIQYLEARGTDEKWRKYRVMMIDGKLYPLHVALSSNWKVHYFSSEMADNSLGRAEEAQFLANMAGVLGPRVLDALTRIQKTLGLDYGGIDFGLNRDGDLVLFEANATMVVLSPGADPRWDYRRTAVEQIYQAVANMLLARANAGAQHTNWSSAGAD